MANTRSAPTFPTAAWLMVVAGVLLLLELLLSRVAPSALDNWLIVLSYLALTIAFVVLFLWRSIDILLRVAFVVAAVGFAILTLAAIPGVDFGVALPKIAEVLVLVGVLVAGILVFMRSIFTRAAGLAFLILGIVVALFFLSALTGFITGTLLVILAILFGVLLIVTGILVARRR